MNEREQLEAEDARLAREEQRRNRLATRQQELEELDEYHMLNRDRRVELSLIRIERRLISIEDRLAKGHW